MELFLLLIESTFQLSYPTIETNKLQFNQTQEKTNLKQLAIWKSINQWKLPFDSSGMGKLQNSRCNDFCLTNFKNYKKHSKNPLSPWGKSEKDTSTSSSASNKFHGEAPRSYDYSPCQNFKIQIPGFLDNLSKIVQTISVFLHHALIFFHLLSQLKIMLF